MIPEDAIWILELIRNRDARTEAEKDAVNAAIEALKAQLSQEGKTKDTTSDTISKTETVEHLRRMLEATVPNTDYDEGFVDGAQFAISTVSTMPPAQPEPKEGQWVNGCCNKCGGHAPFWAMASTYYKSDFCPHCGAKMKGAEHETN